MNPFKFGHIVQGPSFCHRPELQKMLRSYVKTAQNCVLQGDRRMGKSSLVAETVGKLKGYRILSIDLMGIKSADELCKRIAFAIISLEQKSGLLEKVLSGFSGLRPKISIDPISGQPSISFDPAIKLTPDSIQGIFDLIQKTGSRKKTVMFIDEFQDILNLPDADEVLAMMRAKIQYHQNIPYVFAGSMRNRMVEIFTSHDSPFFKSALPLEVGPIDPSEFIPFLTQKFASGNRTLSYELGEQIMELADHTSGDTQQLCSAIWETSRHGDSLKESHLAPALEQVFSQEIKGYQAVQALLTAQQTRCLKALASIGGQSPTSGAFLRESGISHASSVKKAITRLVQLQIIYPKENEFRFINPFFKHWLLWKQI